MPGHVQLGQFAKGAGFLASLLIERWILPIFSQS
jgi:hypothetical protein